MPAEIIEFPRKFSDHSQDTSTGADAEIIFLSDRAEPEVWPCAWDISFVGDYPTYTDEFTFPNRETKASVQQPPKSWLDRLKNFSRK